MGLSTEWAVWWRNLGLWMGLSTDLAFWWISPSGYAPQLANTLASCSSQAAQANPKGLLRLDRAADRVPVWV